MSMRRMLAVVAILALGLFALSAVAGEYGKCSFNSDCHSGVKCSSGKCADSAGSSCSFDSDCGGNGAKCNSGKCSTAPDGKCSFNSECPGGSCSSGKCKF
ncbi:MAG TPA: hypothetical protein PK668_20545 [Myxococcota bacterium]|nr:hypothetical protein [Myxococcota bacterium]HRY96220.1 hypothetical protein [Myxococcota bacterium]